MTPEGCAHRIRDHLGHGRCENRRYLFSVWARDSSSAGVGGHACDAYNSSVGFTLS